MVNPILFNWKCIEVFSFSIVRFYIESISYLKDNATIELFFLNAKSIIYKVNFVFSLICEQVTLCIKKLVYEI